MKIQSIKYPQVPYSRDAGGYCPVTGEPGGFYLGNTEIIHLYPDNFSLKNVGIPIRLGAKINFMEVGYVKQIHQSSRKKMP